MMKSEANSGPKETVARISNKVGGMRSASAPGQLPRNERQVKYLKQVSRSLEYNPADELYSVMFQAKQEDGSNTFVRDIKVLPDPAIVLATDYQLDDMVRFSTRVAEHCILTIDPTFSLGEFDVTPVTYRHLLLEARRGGKPPVCIGAFLIHYKKTFQTYLFFASSLVGQRKDLAGVLAFGTDGEEALADAFNHEFKFAVHLTCYIHKRRNVEKKLQEIQFTAENQKAVMDDIFGRRVGDTFYEGLVDAHAACEFDLKLSQLKDRWANLDPQKSDRFYEWFLTYESGIIKQTMLRSVREKAGLGIHPEHFTTNPSESINAVLKTKVDYKRSDLPVFVKKMHQLSMDQRQEIERAIINRGKYTLKSQYKHLEVAESKWFRMSRAQRDAHLRKFAQAQVAAVSDDAQSSVTAMKESFPAEGTLSVDVNDAASGSPVSLTLFQGIWSKALKLITSEGNIAAAPGYSLLARTVKSSSTHGFRTVTPGRSGKFVCDCPNCQSLGICAHTVAVAEVNQKLPEFVAWYRKAKSCQVFQN